MSQYNTFNHKNRKLNEIWNKSENNTDKLKNVPIISLNFNSINFNKKITTIQIINNQETPWKHTETIQTILLENFPENMLNMIEPTVVYSIEDGFVSNFTESGIKADDVYIANQKWKYWFNRIDNKHFFLKIFYTIDIRQKIEGFPYYLGVPVNINMSLKIYNQRIYETTNEKFE